MKPTDDWRLCEMNLVSKTIGEPSREAKKINQGGPELEGMRQTAAKGFIKCRPPLSSVSIAMLSKNS